MSILDELTELLYTAEEIKKLEAAGTIRLETRDDQLVWVHCETGQTWRSEQELDVVQVPEIKTTLEGEGR